VTRYVATDDFRGAQFVDVNMSRTVFREVDLSDTRMYGVLLTDADIDGDIGPGRWTRRICIDRSTMSGRSPKRCDISCSSPTHGLVMREPNPAPGRPPPASRTATSCLHVIFDEEWAHHQFAVRDLAIIESLGR